MDVNAVLIAAGGAGGAGVLGLIFKFLGPIIQNFFKPTNAKRIDTLDEVVLVLGNIRNRINKPLNKYIEIQELIFKRTWPSPYGFIDEDDEDALQGYVERKEKDMNAFLMDHSDNIKYAFEKMETFASYQRLFISKKTEKAIINLNKKCDKVRGLPMFASLAGYADCDAEDTNIWEVISEHEAEFAEVICELKSIVEAIEKITKKIKNSVKA